MSQVVSKMQVSLYCPACGRYQPAIVYRRQRELFPEFHVSYQETYAICGTCGLELYSPAMNDANCEARERAVLSCKAEQNESCLQK